MARLDAPLPLFAWPEIAAKQKEVEAHQGAVKQASLKFRCAYHGVKRQRQQEFIEAQAALLRSELELEKLWKLK